MADSETDARRATRAGFRLRRAILLFGAGVIILIVAADAYEGWQDYRSSLQRSQQVLVLLSNAFSEQTARMMQELDFALGDFAEQARQSRVDSGHQQALDVQLEAHIARLPYIHTVTVLDAAGVRVATTNDDPTIVGSVSAFPGFVAVRDDRSNAVHIGRPWTSRRDGYRTFSLSRRLSDASGRFAGIVIARVSFDYLTRSYQAVGVSPGAEIRLIRSDGVTLALYPPPAGDAPAVQTPPDLMAVSRVRQYPLTVQVSQSRHDALADWRQQELESAVRTATLALLAAVLLWAMNSALRRREQAEVARRETDARLQEARRAESLSLLAASVAHDFNNVLGAIVGYAELIRETNGRDSQLDANVGRLLGAAERARQLVRRVLTLDTHRSLRNQSVPLAPLIREVADQLQTRSTRPHRFELSLQDESLAVSGDVTEVYQVLLNLCTNALQAMPGGGTVKVILSAVHRPDTAPLTVGGVRPGDYVQVTIVDEGPGVTPEQASRIFDPLQTSKNPESGTGIGLTVVRTIVERMHGAVDVHSSADGGASFTLYFPRQFRQAAESTQPVPAAPRPGAGQVVMIVDDEPQLVSVLEDLTASLGYEPIGLTDPARAIHVFERAPGRVDALITDERMPGMRGVELARRLRDRRGTLPVILVTGYRSAELDREAGGAGIDHILDKPIHKAELARALGALLH